MNWNRQKDKLIVVAFRFSAYSSKLGKQKKFQVFPATASHSIYFGYAPARSHVRLKQNKSTGNDASHRTNTRVIRRFVSENRVSEKTRLVIYWLHVLRLLCINTIICIFPFNRFSIFFVVVSLSFSFSLSCPNWIELLNGGFNRWFHGILHKSREKRPQLDVYRTDEKMGKVRNRNLNLNWEVSERGLIPSFHNLQFIISYHGVVTWSCNNSMDCEPFHWHAVILEIINSDDGGTSLLNK